MSIYKIILFLILVVVFIWGGTWINRRIDERAAAQQLADQQKVQEANNKLMESLKKEDVVVGTGTEALSGHMVTVNYVGTLDNGQKFDSSYDRKEPYTFQLGAGVVIKGWDLGVAGMKVGGKRILTIPPELGYGSNANGPIPANATLHFTVELLEVK